ncbi:hypothetical protein [Mumia zhuanghuii]|uniref:Uncharacterized protein n=1 Tax=Mumia zhuanghuii TaxID=2585211 RepID=A0A5C4LW92_9ACTN|nr:hypothetical protein [Mumia zhuanghuii]TNC22440.1 hypothetical protein FHE65_35760 [Mumia zhuanghuii]
MEDTLSQEEREPAPSRRPLYRRVLKAMERLRRGHWHERERERKDAEAPRGLRSRGALLGN